MTPQEKLMALMASKKASMKKAEKTAKMEPGEQRIVLLPGWRGEEDPTWWHDFGQHFVKDSAGQIQAVYLCTNATFERECEVCKALAAAGRAAADDDVSKVLEEAKASKSVLINALHLDSKEPNTPKITEIKRGLFEQLVDICTEYEGAPLDPNGAIIIKVNRDGKGLNTKYTAMPTAKKVKVDAAILGKINNLDEYVKQESEENLRRAIGAVNAAAGLAAPVGGSSGGSTARLAAPAPADDLDDDLPPAKSKPAAKAPALDDDIDDLLADLPE